MVDVIGRAKVIVSGDVDSASIDQAGGKIGAGLKKGAVIGVAALGTLAVAGVKAVKSFEEAESVSRKLNQVLDNMGKSDATPAVEKLADSLQRLTGIDDEVIKGGQTILATFSEVAETAGDVGGVFDRATRAAVDLAATGFGDVSSASKILGKALQDPEKGVTALSRAGVTFTQGQKDQIKAMLEANDAAGAQAIILGEVEKQVKGTAEAASKESEKISRALGEIQETAGGLLIDLFTDEETEDATSFSEALFKVNDELKKLDESESWDSIGDVLGATGQLLLFLGDKLGDFIGYFEDVGARTGKQVDDTRAVLRKWRTDWADNIHIIRQRIGDFIEDVKAVPEKISDAIPEWAKAGGKLLAGFIKGLAAGGIPGVLAQKIKDAINEALPNSITFFGGKGGVPAITVPIPQLASGGPASGLTLVGERGPELVNLPNGSYVNNNNDTKEMLSGGGDTVVINNQYFGPVTGNEQKKEIEWTLRYGLRFGTQTGFSPSVVNS